MSHLVSRILLSIFLMPVAVLSFAISMCFMERGGYSPGREVTRFICSDALCAGVVAIYWLLIWRTAVNWTLRRRGLTFAAAGIAIVAGCVLGIVMSNLTRISDPSFAVFMAGVFAMLIWLIATIFIWRENAEERAARVARSGMKTVSCPNCGYNLTGLSEARCPECGAKYTLDELMALQTQVKMDVE